MRYSVGRTRVSTATRRRRRWLWIIPVFLFLLSVTALMMQSRLTGDGGRGLAAEAMVTASSTELGYSPSDVVGSGDAASPGATWQSAGETVGAWVELFWPRSHLLRQIVIVRNPVAEAGVTGGFLSFGDGSFLQVTLSATVDRTVVPISLRSADRVRFTASVVSSGTQSVTIAEIVVRGVPGDGDVVTDDVPDGNSALGASVTQDARAGASDPRELVDGSGAPGSGGVGADWTASRPAGAWVQLDWARPRELTSIALVGSRRSGSALSAATLTFGDGSRLPVGAVLADPDRPTVVSFMPRVTTSVRITIQGVTGADPLVLGELRAYQRAATPVRATPGISSGRQAADVIDCAAPAAGAPGLSMVVSCPPSGAVVDGVVELQVVPGAGYSAVEATVWTAEVDGPVGAPVRAEPDAAGIARLAVDVRAADPDPLTVEVAATGPQRERRAVHFQLYRRVGDRPEVDVASSAPATGRTLVYAEEFDGPVSLSRTGLGADYAAAKPTHNGAEDFGDAIFADPALGFDSVRVVDDRYLRIDVEPLPAGYSDPQGWGRTHLGGMLASARPGGSGFSAQYGYFEARMLAPAAPGTWPAFWMLPSDNLIAPTPVVAEIDAVELYGHEPKGTCHVTHDYQGGRDDGVSHCGQRFPNERDALSWHTYGVSITPVGITFYVDGSVVATAPQVSGGSAPLFFLVNFALGGGWPVDLAAVQGRAALYVDYVRVFV
jgi:Glycosyl hydrolases family 16